MQILSQFEKPSSDNLLRFLFLFFVILNLLNPRFLLLKEETYPPKMSTYIIILFIKIKDSLG
jgi:hypothetical protein